MDDTPKTRCARKAAADHPVEHGHLEQVAFLADALFDAFQPLHGLGGWQREMLCCAALLHDLGLSVSVSKHHKHSLILILQTPLPALTTDERLIVANLARYHRKAWPKDKHAHFAELQPAARDLVLHLAPILRIADGLDRAHENAVDRVAAQPQAPGRWTLDIYGSGDLGFAAWGGSRKAGHFEKVYAVSLAIEPRGPAMAADAGGGSG